MSGMGERAPRGGRVFPTPSPVAAASPSGGALAHAAPTCDECGGNDRALTLGAERGWPHQHPQRCELTHPREEYDRLVNSLPYAYACGARCTYGDDPLLEQLRRCARNLRARIQELTP
jgi:hypothetical protein